MRVVSIQMKKKQWIGLAVLAVLLILAIVLAVRPHRAVTASADFSCDAATDAQRKAFLAQFGWTVQDDPVEICEVIIPDTFNDVYRAYNELQKSQGLDLTRYMGKRVKRWTYELTNYPDGDAQTRVYADLLISDGRVIGGSIGTRAADGFMRGFRRDSAEWTASSGASVDPVASAGSGGEASSGWTETASGTVSEAVSVASAG